MCDKKYDLVEIAFIIWISIISITLCWCIIMITLFGGID